MIKCNGKITKSDDYVVSEMIISGTPQNLLLELATIQKILIESMRSADIPDNSIEKTLVHTIKTAFDLADAEKT